LSNAARRDYDGRAMGCSITFHDKIGRDRIEAAVEPLSHAAAMDLIESAVDETARLTLGKRDVEVELTICGDPEMERLNFDHMGERGPTDVLSFPLHEWSIDGDGAHSHLTEEDGLGPPGAPLLLGDVVIDLDQAVRQAADGGWSVAEEIVLLAIHGMLHVLGHDHAELDEEERMRAAEREVLHVLHRRHREVDWQPGSLFDRAGHAVTMGS
jgi:probable rRNA maturation factor